MDENPTSTILVVDDEPVIREGLETLLTGGGYAVASAGDGAEALAKAAELTPDLVLLDVKMPGLDGFEVCQRLRADPLLAEVPIIMVTALADRDSRLRGFEVGADDFVSKPFDEIELLARVRTTTRLNRYRRLLQAQEALRESEERYRTISELTSDVAYVVLVEPDGTTVPKWMAGALTRITGFSLDELEARGGWPTLMHPDDMPLALQHLQTHLTGQPDVAEYRIIAESGQVRWLRDYGYPVWDDTQGRVVRIIGAAQDITERKRTEEALRQAHDELETRVGERTAELVEANERLREEIAERRQAEDLIRLQRDLSVALGATDGLTPALGEVLETVLRIEGIDSCGIYLVDRSTGELDLAVYRGLSPEFVAAISHYVADFHQARLVTQGEAVYRQHADIAPVMDSIWQNEGLRALAIVPVQYEGQAIAVLNGASHACDEISAAARQSLETIAGLVGRAIAGIRTQKALRESEERYRTLFEDALIGIYRAAPDGRVLAANPALIQMLGYTSFDDLAALNPEQDGFTAVQPRSLVKELIERVGGVTGLEYMWVRRDRSAVFVRESARARRGQDGAIIYYEGVVEDVTARKQAESALHLSEQEFRNVIEQASDGIVLTDEQGRIVEWNQGQERITGLKREDAIGLPFWDVHFRLIPGDRDDEPFREMIMASLHRFFRTGQALWLNQPIEYDIQRSDGTRRIIQVVAFPGQTENGFVIGSVARDVTEQIKVQEEIRRRNRELAALNEMGQAITSTLDLRETLMLITSHTNRLMGTQATSVLLHDEERDDLYFAAGSGLGADFVLGRRLALGQGIAGWAVEHDEPALVPDVSQDPRWFGDFDKGGGFTTRSILCVPLRSKGRVIGALEAINKESGFGQDDLHLLSALVAPVSTAIENSRLFEQVRRGREQLQALSRRLVEVQETERGYIARELHDETSQVLSALLLSLSLLEHEAHDPDAVLARTAELEKLAEDMLEDLHRLAVNLRPAVLDHLGLVAALEQYVETFGRRYGITARFETVGLSAERMLPDVETAFYRIAQEAMTNVARHAKATRVDVLLERRDDRIVLIVEDNGAGFDPAAALRSGRLGVFGMQERAQMLDGNLEIESTLGEGTTVLVEVPYAYSHSDRR